MFFPPTRWIEDKFLVTPFCLDSFGRKMNLQTLSAVKLVFPVRGRSTLVLLSGGEI